MQIIVRWPIYYLAISTWNALCSFALCRSPIYPTSQGIVVQTSQVMPMTFLWKIILLEKYHLIRVTFRNSKKRSNILQNVNEFHFWIISLFDMRGMLHNRMKKLLKLLRFLHTLIVHSTKCKRAHTYKIGRVAIKNRNLSWISKPHKFWLNNIMICPWFFNMTLSSHHSCSSICCR